MRAENDNLQHKSDSQFGLRSLMVLVAFVAALLAFLRALNVPASQSLIGLAAILLTIAPTILVVDLTRRVR